MIWITIHDGFIMAMINVIHVLEFKKILVSLSTLDSNGCAYKLEVELLEFQKSKKLMFLYIIK